MSLIDMTFAENLKSELSRLGLTQAQAADILDVSPRAIWKWLHGDAPELSVTREGIIARLLSRGDVPAHLRRPNHFRRLTTTPNLLTK